MIKKILMSLITNHAGSVSSKIVIGIISYLSLLIAIILLMFTNPAFPGLSELITFLIITSASLLGLTTVENISQKQTSIDFKKSRESEEESEEETL